MSMKTSQSGFTLVEIAIVLLIVTILLGYTVAMFPQQQQLKQYRAVNQEMDQILEAVIGFAQVNGRLPCPALVTSNGNEDFDDDGSDPEGCNNYGGFVPFNTLGLDARLNADNMMEDPWGNPYRYYVSNVDFNSNNLSDFVYPGEMRLVGLVDTDSDGYIDLDGQYLICADPGATTNDQCADAANTIFGRYSATPDRYAGAPFVLLSMGKNWNEGAPTGDELENSGATLVNNGGAGAPDYRIKNVGSETVFVQRPGGGLSDDLDDVVRWVSPNVLFARMIQANQLP